jgi:hypothetical protein
MMAYCEMQISVPEHLVIESKPDNSVDDLRCEICAKKNDVLCNLTLH